MFKVLTLLSFIFLPLSIFAQRTMNLEEAIQIALQKNTTLVQRENTIKGYESTVKSAYGNLLPSLGAGASWQWQRSETEAGTYIINNVPQFIPEREVETRSLNASVGTDWVLFDGLSNFATISQSRNDLSAARYGLQRLREDIIFQTTGYYYDILNAKEQVKVNRDDLEYNRKNLEIFTEKNKLGAITLADVYAQQVRTGNSEIAVIQSENVLENLKSEFLDYLGIDVFQEVELASPDKADSIEISNENILGDYDDLSQLVRVALENRSDYKSAQFDLKSSQNGITIARSGYLPRLTNSADFSVRGDNFGNLTDAKFYTVGLNLSLPIFSGWSTENQVQLAKVQAKNAEIQVNELERQIKVNLKKTYLDLQAAKKRLEVGAQNVKSATQNRMIEQEKYNLGSGTLVNLLLAGSEFTSAQQNYINTVYDYYILKAQLEYYLGTLKVKDFE